MFGASLHLSLINSDEFYFRSQNLFGVDCVLIFPKNTFDATWNDHSKYFRSSLWTVPDYKPISLGFRKFTCLFEKPEFEPLDYNKPFEYILKVDGTCAIISKINGNLIIRTRHSFDTYGLENHVEVRLLKNKYPKIFDNDILNSEQYTILTEWTTPNNVIVLKETQEPELWLTGIVKHEDYSYFSQVELDRLAKEWNIRRPERFYFKTEKEMLGKVEAFKDKEGIIIYGNRGQVLKKVKSAHYLMLHHFKENATIENVLCLYLEYGCPDYNSFVDILGTKFDWECVEYVRGIVSKICDAEREVNKIITGLTKSVGEVRLLDTRKKQALKIFEKYGQGSRAGMCFTILDHGQINNEQKKKLFFQVLKGN